MGNLRNVPNGEFIPSLEDVFGFKEDAVQVIRIYFKEEI
jgi:hypothetical protein